MHLQEIVRTAPVVGPSAHNDPFLILHILAGNCEICVSYEAKKLYQSFLAPNYSHPELI